MFLEQHNIHIDIVTHLDEFNAAFKHFKNIKDMNFLSKTTFLLSATTSQSIINLLNKENIFLFESGTKYSKNSLKPSAGCVGSLTYQMLLLLDVKELYLLGLDLATDIETNKTHISTHMSSKTLSKDTEQLTYKQSLIPVEGNKHKEVFTTPHFKTSIDILNLSTNSFKKDYMNIYNLGDGAKFQNIPYIQLPTIKNNTVVDVKHNFLTKAFKHLDEKLLKEKKEKHKEFYIKIKEFRNVENFEDYLQKLKSFYLYFVQDSYIKDYEISRVFDLYFKYILPHIFNASTNFYKINQELTHHLLTMLKILDKELDL